MIGRQRLTREYKGPGAKRRNLGRVPQIHRVNEARGEKDTALLL